MSTNTATAKAKSTKSKPKAPARAPRHEDSEGEFFDLNAISSDDEYDGAPPAPRMDMDKLKRLAAGKSKAPSSSEVPSAVKAKGAGLPDPVPPPRTNDAPSKPSTKPITQPGEVDFFDDSSDDELPKRIMSALKPRSVQVHHEADIPVMLADRMSTLSISSPCPSDSEHAQALAGRRAPIPPTGKRMEVIELSD